MEEVSVSIVIKGATIIDAVSDRPIEGEALWIERGRIQAIARVHDLKAPASAQVVDARGKFVIPGLMDANVHLMGDIRPENVLRHMDHYPELIVEAAQVALKGGLTTVFDTWGPRAHLMAVRDRINAGTIVGSRFFCAGNIVGLDGPFSPDFFGKADILSAAMAERINAQFVENVGPALSWMTPQQVASEIRTYLAKGIDFIKYASSEHRYGDPTTFLVFSERAQRAIVDEAHRAGVTAQAHTMAVEGLRVAIEAGCDLIQHCNITGRTAIPEETLELFAERKTGAVIIPFTQKRFDWIMSHCKADSPYMATSDSNCRNLMRSGARLLLCTDAILFAPEVATDPTWNNFWLAPGEDNLAEFGRGHFVWLKAMEEKGYPAMEILRAATRNIAIAYKKDRDLGTLEPGKVADMLILDKNPLQSAQNYRAIHMILKDGVVVNREALPEHPIQTRPAPEASPEALTYRAHRHYGRSTFPRCC